MSSPKLHYITAALTVCAGYASSQYGILCVQNANLFVWLMSGYRGGHHA